MSFKYNESWYQYNMLAKLTQLQAFQQERHHHPCTLIVWKIQDTIQKKFIEASNLMVILRFSIPIDDQQNYIH